MNNITMNKFKIYISTCMIFGLILFSPIYLNGACVDQNAVTLNGDDLVVRGITFESGTSVACVEGVEVIIQKFNYDLVTETTVDTAVAEELTNTHLTIENHPSYDFEMILYQDVKAIKENGQITGFNSFKQDGYLKVDYKNDKVFCAKYTNLDVVTTVNEPDDFSTNHLANNKNFQFTWSTKLPEFGTDPFSGSFDLSKATPISDIIPGGACAPVTDTTDFTAQEIQINTVLSINPKTIGETASTIISGKLKAVPQTGAPPTFRGCFYDGNVCVRQDGSTF